MTTLTERAMLSHQRLSRWTARRFDRQITDEVHAQHNAIDAGRFNKKLLAADALKQINHVAREARMHHYTHTLPWEHAGARILPAPLYWDYTKAQRRFSTDFQKAVDAFIADYPAFVKEAKQRLNGLFNPDDYPPVDRLASMFALDVTITPLPDASDWRVSLGDAEERRIRKSIEKRLKQTLAEATTSLWHRLYEAVSHLHDRLADTDGRLHESVIANLRELTELLPKLNIAGDPELERLRQDIADRLASQSVPELRDDAALRESTARTAADILDAMSGYVGGDVR